MFYVVIDSSLLVSLYVIVYITEKRGTKRKTEFSLCSGIETSSVKHVSTVEEVEIGQQCYNRE